MRDIGKNIRALREQKGMTQEDFAGKLFVTRQTVSNYETGKSRPDIDMLVRIAQVLETDVNEVLYGPPVNRDRKGRLCRLAAVGVVLLLSGVLLAVLWTAVTEWSYYRNLMTPNLLIRVMLRPIWLLALGWWVLEGLGLLLKAKPLSGSWVKKARRGLLLLLCLCGAVLLPFGVWQVVTTIEMLNATEGGSWSFPSDPVYAWVLMKVVMLNLRFPFLYAGAGGLLWLLGFPAGRPRAEERK